MGGGSVEEGFALETEIGLFAMKRDAVFRALDPFLKLDIDVDIVQLTPLVLYNFLVFDQMGDLPPPEEFDPENPPESVVIISMGTDATDLVITNGFRVWQRSIPLGGSHFTKALTRELKLTFAKAEHLKRNATAASDPKAVFQAMKPVFSDLLTELQRSIGYFSNLDRAAKIGRIVALGNAMKLPGPAPLSLPESGLRHREDRVVPRSGRHPGRHARPPSRRTCCRSACVTAWPCRAWGRAAVHTNLLPKEIVQGRLINRKKPWAVAAAAMLLLGCSISYAAYSMALGGVDADTWKQAQTEASQLKDKVEQPDERRWRGPHRHLTETNDDRAENLVGNVEGRIRWLELLKAINACLPHDDPPAKPDDPPIPIAAAQRVARYEYRLSAGGRRGDVVRGREEVGRNRGRPRRQAAGECRRPPPPLRRTIPARHARRQSHRVDRPNPRTSLAQRRSQQHGPAVRSQHAAQEHFVKRRSNCPRATTDKWKRCR